MPKMKPNRRKSVALLSSALFLFLILALPVLALGQGFGDSNETLATTAEQHMDPAATPVPLDCDNPLPGEVAKLVDNDEIMLAYAGLGSPLYIAKLDNKSDGSKDLVENWDWRYHSYTGASITTADLDGDDKAEVVMGYTTGSGLNKGELGALSLKNPEVDDKSQLETDSWSSSSNYRYGFFGPISVAAGNLDGSLAGGDKADEVVLAFRDADNQRLQVVLLDGESDGGIKGLTSWTNTDHGRTYILSRIAVDVGDVDSNGYDDDIVLAFVDKDQDIQVVVLKLNQQGGVTETGWESWTNDDRGDINWKSDRTSIDVVTGDFNGDYTDEIAVAFRDGKSALQIMQVVYDPNASTLRGRVNSSGWWRDTSHYRNDVASVSVTAGDIDGDGNEEIISSFADKRNHLGLVTLDAESANPKLRGSYGSGSGELSYVSFTSVAAGDLDAQGEVEVVVSFADHDFDVQVVSFNDNPDCPCDDDASSGLIRRDGWTKAAGTTNIFAPFGISLGDVNGDSIYGDYTGVCTETMQVRMTAMAGRPPYYEGLNNTYSDVGYGKSSSSEKTSEQEFTTSYGSSVTFDAAFKFAEIEIGGSVTKEWEDSISESTTSGTKIETRDGWTQDEDGIVPISGVAYYSYQYKRRDNNALARVGVPVNAVSDAKVMSYWNEPDGMRALAPTSWVPAYRSGWMDKVGVPGSFGASNQGAGADYYEINGTGTSDYLFAWIDNPSGENSIHYRIGWDPGADGKPASWSATYQVPDPGGDGIGYQTSGLGAAVTELNGNSTPELVVAWVANPSGNNWAAYKIGWDMAHDGSISSWSGKKTIPGWVGGSTQGVGLDIIQFGGDARPEMFFGWIDNPADVNRGYYRVGWNLDANGDTDDWWTYPKHIEGAFGPENQGLGLTLADMDGSDHPEMIAAWVRTPHGENEWAYSVGEEMDENAYVGSWAPGQPVAGSVGDSTDFAALASTDLVTKTGKPELVVGWIDNPSGDNAAYLRVGQYWPIDGEPDMYPTAVVTTTTDGEFRINLFDQWWNVKGDLNWRWDDANNPMAVGVGSAYHTWSVDHTAFTEHTTGTSASYNIEIGGEAKFMDIGVEGSTSYGFEEGSSQSISWEKGWYMEGKVHGLPAGTPQSKGYEFVPFTYMQEAMSIDGVTQAYMVLDYMVPYIGPITLESVASAPLAAPRGITPSIPLITSPSHPDPDVWYPTGTVVFAWTQPAGDPAVVDGYRWYLDRHPDTVPSEFVQDLTDTTTYEDFPDGLWWLHLRARGDGGDWSETAHRAVRLDAHPPQVGITHDPPLPIDNGGWYNTPVTVAIDADDSSTSEGQAGSGVQSIEISTDGVSWQPYTDLIVFATDSPPLTLWARATDMVGHISEPVSTTFGLDLTLPNSVEGLGCWEFGGDCLADVIIDTVGNQRLRLSGEFDGSLSGEKGLRIEINGQQRTSANEVGDGRWSFTSDSELGAGCHTFNIQGEDRAGNVEPLHAFGDTVVWHPQERPDLSGSSLSIVPDHVRPGDTVNVTLVAPNSSWQETWVPISVLLPTGLEVQPDTISSDGVYDPAARLITWPPQYLWPGEENRFTFSAQVDAGLPATQLSILLTALGTWPIAETCPADERPGFQDLQTTVEVTTVVTVNPDLPDNDLLAPASPFLRIEEGAATNLREVQLHIDAADPEDAAWMYLSEWVWSSDDDAWIVTQNSGWLPYNSSHPWTLSEGDGVKYLGVWLADASWNVSVLDHHSLAFTNLLQSVQALSDGQRIQYRFPMQKWDLAIFNVTAREGNPDLHVWQPFSGFRPHYSATSTDFVDTVGFQAPKQGLYLVEVQAEGDSEYQLLLGGDIGPRAVSASQFTANTPEHPLTVSDPLSAGVAVAPTFPALYLPMMTIH